MAAENPNKLKLAKIKKQVVDDYMQLLLQEGNKKKKTERKKGNCNGKQLIVWSVDQLKDYRPLRGHEVTGGKYRSAKRMKVYEQSSPCFAVFSQLS